MRLVLDVDEACVDSLPVRAHFVPIGRLLSSTSGRHAHHRLASDRAVGSSVTGSGAGAEPNAVSQSVERKRLLSVCSNRE